MALVTCPNCNGDGKCPICHGVGKIERAREAVKLNPTASNRTIARQIGVSEQTVRRAIAPDGAPKKSAYAQDIGAYAKDLDMARNKVERWLRKYDKHLNTEDRIALHHVLQHAANGLLSLAQQLVER